jgi:hypothetical protein
MVVKPTATLRRTVREMKACGESHETIAAALDITVSALLKHYRHQLDHGLAMQRRIVIGMLWSQARKGNLSAIARLEQLTRSAGAAISFLDRMAPKPAAKPAPRGKKELAMEAAATAGADSDWGEDLQVPAPRPN